MVPYALAANPTIFPRPNFRGLTDKYADYNGKFAPTQTDMIQRALRGDAPFDPYGGLINVDYRDTAVQRLERYRYEWRWYEGDHYDAVIEDGSLKSKTNYCKIVVDKSVNFFCGGDWKIKTVEGNEQIAQLLNDCWNRNGKRTLTRKAQQFASINGDVYILAMICTTDPKTGKPLKRKKWFVSLQVIDPKFVFPFFSRTDSDEMQSCLIQYPSAPPDMETETMLFSMLITPDSFFIFNNETLIEEIPNPFGRLNIVRVKNKERANSSFGESDLEEVIPLNEEANETSNSIRRTVKYHGEPTTLVYGARVSDLERGAKKIWSGLPQDAKVENLKMEGDLEESINRLAWLEQRILVTAEIPRIALDLEASPKISNTSGIAIQMLWQPLIEKTERKQEPWTAAVIELDQLILIGTENQLGKNIEDLADNVDALYDSDVEYTSPLPRDEAADIDSGLKKVDAGVWSLAEFIRKNAGVDDLERLSVELASDRASELLMAYENQRAALGVRPNILAALTGSTVLSEDLTALRAQLANAQKRAEPPKKKPKPVAIKTTKQPFKLKLPKFQTKSSGNAPTNQKPKQRFRTATK